MERNNCYYNRQLSCLNSCYYNLDMTQTLAIRLIRILGHIPTVRCVKNLYFLNAQSMIAFPKKRFIQIVKASALNGKKEMEETDETK
jgi:hypothetical protein